MRPCPTAGVSWKSRPFAGSVADVETNALQVRQTNAQSAMQACNAQTHVEFVVLMEEALK